MKLNKVATHMLNRVAQVKHYSWGNDFNVEEMLSAYQQSIAFLVEEGVNFLKMSSEELKEYGFGKWSEESELMLVPIWAYDMIPDGTELKGIFGNSKIKGTDEIDMDIRGGCLAYGIIPSDFIGKLEETVLGKKED